MADTPTDNPAAVVKKGVKKVPTPILVGGGIAVVAAVIYLKTHKKAEASATPSAEEGLTSQAFIPTTGGAGLGAIPGNNSEALSDILSIVSADREREQKQSDSLLEYVESSDEKRSSSLESLVESISASTGGGAPASQPAGTVSATPTTGGSPPPAVLSPSAPAKKAPTAKKPYRDCKGQHAGQDCHCYPDGHTECQHKVGNKWVW